MAAQSDYPCLLTGEAGTGKKVLAQVIHSESGRHEGPYYYLNCSSVPKRAIEAELFGSVSNDEGGLDTGHMGILELADGGTVHLDSIGELPLPLQGKLLKYIDTGEFVKSGSDEIRHTKVRMIASSRADLMIAMQRGLFRQELYNRLVCNRIETVPIRNRKEDIPLLVDYLMTEILYPKSAASVTLKPSFYDRLTKYDWPGNVRELQRALQLIVYRSQAEKQLEERHVAGIEEEIFSADHKDQTLNLDKLEKTALIKAIEISAGNMSQAARLLGIGRSTLYRKMERYGIELHQNETLVDGNSKDSSKMIQMVTPT